MARVSLSAAASAVMGGTAPLLFLPAIPSLTVLWLLLVGGIVGISGRLPRVAGILLLSLAWALFNAHQVLDTLSAIDEKALRVEVSMVETHITDHQDMLVLVRVEKINDRWVFPAFYARVKPTSEMLAWCAGQRWQMTAQFRPLHSHLNEGGFDRQRWGVATRQLATARISEVSLLDASCNVRQRLITQMEQQAAALPWRSVLLALAFGEMKTMPQAIRDAWVQTGTMHLMVISGLHIGLAALFGFWWVRVAQRGFPTGWIGHRLPVIVGVVIAWGYTWLAGGNPPALRAALAFSLWALIRWHGIHCSAWQVWLWCLALILLSDPLMIISNSFWLSCVAVAGLIFWFQWAPLPDRYRYGWRWAVLRLAHLELGITLLLMPLQWGIFQGNSMTALPANLWAVPLVSLVITPLVLLAIPLAPFPVLSHAVWWLADRAMNLVYVPLSWLQQGWVTVTAPYLYWSLIGWLGVMVWRFGWWRSYPTSLLALGLYAVSARFMPSPPDWRLDVLDVGQGLAIVIESQGKAILYDTGTQWSGGDSAQYDILPHLRWRGITPQAVIISHNHPDHLGGLATLQQAYPELVVYSPLATASHRPCVQGTVWQWQKLTFTVLWPPQRTDYSGTNDHYSGSNNHYADSNNRCVVQIDDGARRVLLTGNIESATERALVATQQAALAADLLQISHSGRRTGATFTFLRAVTPRYVLTSTGRYNRLRLPPAAVIDRYRREGITWMDTALAGQLSVRFFNDKWDIRRYREQLSPHWYHQWFGVRHDNE